MIRKDGFYINQNKYNSQFDEYIEITSILYFTKNDLVLYICDDEGTINPEQVPSELFDLEYGSILTHELGKYIINGNSIKITYPLYDISKIDKEYQEFKGVIKDNCLLLDHTICSWNEIHEDYYIKKVETNQTFMFYYFSDNKPISVDLKKRSSSLNTENKKNNLQTTNNDLIKTNIKNRNTAIFAILGFIGALIGTLLYGVPGFFSGAVSGFCIAYIIKTS